MIHAKRLNETTGVLSIEGDIDDILEEYKRITYSLLNNYFDELMAAMDRWNDEIKEHNKND